MSAILAIAGSYIGAGGFTTAFGMQMGAMLLGKVFGSKQVAHGPRLDDLAVQSSQTGAFIPKIYGSVRTTGNVIWSKPLRETSQRSGGGGSGGPEGPEQVNYSYYWTGMLLLGESSYQILKIWANKTVLYDYNGGTELGTYRLTRNGSTGVWTDSEDRIAVYCGNDNQPADAIHAADKGAYTPAYIGRTTVRFKDFLLTDYGNQIPTFTFLVKGESNLWTVVCEDLVNKVGLDASNDADFTWFTGKTTKGYVMAERRTAAQWLEDITKRHFVSVSEYDSKIRIRDKREASVRTLSSDYMNYQEVSGAGFPEADVTSVTVKERTTQKPHRVELEHYDVTRDYNTNIAHYTRQVVPSRVVNSYAIPEVLRPEEARQLAQTDVMQQWAEDEEHTFNLAWRDLDLVPGDIIVRPLATGTAVVRLETIDYQLFAPMVCKGVKCDSSIFTQTEAPAPDELTPTTPPTYAAPDYVIWEGNSIIDAHNDRAGFYIAVAGTYANGYTAAPYVKVKSYGQYLRLNPYGAGNEGTTMLSLPYNAYIGTTFDALPDLGTLSYPFLEDGGELMDRTNTLTVDLQIGELSSVSEEDLFGGANAAYVAGEYIQFQNATYDADNSPAGKKRYILSNIIRGQRGTEYKIGSHAPGDTFVLLDNAVTFVPIAAAGSGIPAAALTIELYSRANTTADTESLTMAGTNLKPYSVANVEAENNPSTHDKSIVWRRRSRYLDYFFESGQDPPLGEQSELYNIYVYSFDDQLKEVVQRASPTLSYTAADQTAVGITPGDTVKFFICQVSATVGDGHMVRVDV